MSVAQISASACILRKPLRSARLRADDQARNTAPHSPFPAAVVVITTDELNRAARSCRSTVGLDTTTGGFLMTSTCDARAGVFIRSIRVRASFTLAAAIVLFTSFADVRAASAGDLDRVARFDIPAQSLDKALLEFGVQAHMQIMFAWKPAIDRLRSPSIKGRYTARQALTALLKGTQIQYATHGHTITVVSDPPQSAATPRPARDDTVAEPSVEQRKGTRSKSKEERPALEEVTVTGTYIRGTAPIGSPLIEYSREAIDESGAATIEEFARQIPENFSGADVLTSVIGGATPSPVFDQTGNNVFGGAAFNLNGIGPAATLTLLDGHRLAPAGADGAFVDVSMIPLSAVERIEILPDGASAIYGSDAVAGVVNIITRKNFQGAQTSVSYGEAADGGADEETVSQLLGHSWSTGNVMMNYEYAGDSGLDASQRDYIPNQGGPDSLVPPNWRNSVLISGNQAIASDTSLSVDALYGTRRYHSIVTVLPTGQSDLYDIRDLTTQSGMSATLTQALARDWSWAITGYYSRVQQESSQLGIFDYAGELSAYDVDDTSVLSTNTGLGGVDLLLEGTALELPGGQLKAAAGASFEAQKFTAGESTTGTENVTQPGTNAHRTESSVYGELAIPLIGAPNALAWTRRLELSAAARADHYSDFGSTVNPKLGVVWSPVEGLNLRGSYGTSYQAPLLSQLASPVISVAQDFPDASSPSGFTDTLYVSGGNPNLQPEKSHSFSGGPDLELDGVSASATYFHTHYTDRVGTPPVANFQTVLSDPVDAPFVTRDPPLEVVEAAFNSPGFGGDDAGLGPAGVAAIFDSRDTNLATTTQSSVSLRVAYRRETDSGVWMPSIAADRQMRNELRASSATPAVQLLDLYGEPARWRAHGSLAWTRGGYGAAVSVNYVGGYYDQFTTPPSPISSWTTVDAHLSYRSPETGGIGMLRGITVALTVENMTDERPPYVAIPLAVTGGAPPVPFDPANASPVGRFVSLQVSKKWVQ
jgi:iron complex outermembrane recepter protein